MNHLTAGHLEMVCTAAEEFLRQGLGIEPVTVSESK